MRTPRRGVRVLCTSILALAFTLAAPSARAQYEPVPPPPVVVTLASNNPQTLLLQSTGVSYVMSPRYGLVPLQTLRPVCAVPCGQPVDPRAPLRIAGPGIVPSGAFLLPANTGEVHLRVHAGSMGRRVGGIILAGLGGGLAFGGAVYLGVSEAVSSTQSKASPAAGASAATVTNAFRPIGGVMLGIGLPSLIAGIVLLATSGTKVETDDGAPLISVPMSGGVRIGANGVMF